MRSSASKSTNPSGSVSSAATSREDICGSIRTAGTTSRRTTMRSPALPPGCSSTENSKMQAAPTAPAALNRPDSGHRAAAPVRRSRSAPPQCSASRASRAMPLALPERTPPAASITSTPRPPVSFVMSDHAAPGGQRRRRLHRPTGACRHVLAPRRLPRAPRRQPNRQPRSHRTAP